MYLASDSNVDDKVATPAVEPIDLDEKLLLRRNGCGSSELNPLLVHVNISRGMDRKDASERRSVFVTGGEQAVIVTGRGCSAFGSCVVDLLKDFPAGHCAGFRGGWIAFWSCGNPELYSRNPQ